MNPVFMVTYNNIDLTKQAVESILTQDVGPLYIIIVNNGSTDGTREWLDELVASHAPDSPGGHQIEVSHLSDNISPAKLANMYMYRMFAQMGFGHVLSVPNDIILPPNLYREFLRWPRGIVTGSMTDNKSFPILASAQAVNECTPMAVTLLRSWIWEALVRKDGYFFDEGFFHYASDCDLALRLASCGIHGIQLDIQYWHYCSASHRLASKEIGEAITFQADLDRDYFEQKWGFKVSDPQYGESAGDINFLGNPSTPST